ncbi:MAG: aconitate hydratase AcnA, partial [Deltaproteobacteria bacterium]
LPDRATIANMAPEYGATMGFFPIDDETLRFLRQTGRSEELVDLVERYTKEVGLFASPGGHEPHFVDTLSLDLSTVEPSLAGPKRPQDRIPLREMKSSFHTVARSLEKDLETQPSVPVVLPDGRKSALTHGSVVIAAITSCTNTSNPSVMIGAGILAQKAVQRGLSVPAHVKTSLAPGSRVVTRYLEGGGLLPALEALGFYVVGYGCTTCIGNSGPLSPPIDRAVRENDLLVAAVLSGNRNFEGRVHPLTRANYLASPPLVVAYALAGTVDIDFSTEPIGKDESGQPVFLRDIWPTQEEIRQGVASALDPERFRAEYANVFSGNRTWNEIEIPEGKLYTWNSASTYIQEPPFFTELTVEEPDIEEIRGARVLALLGDSVTTDHISPAGAIPKESPAGRYLIEHGVQPEDFNSFGSRRGNHEVMMRGTFGNIRLRNRLVPGTEGGYTLYLPEGARGPDDGEPMSIYDAAMKYRAHKRPLIVLAGKEYGTGSSRDWAAKGTILLGVRAVVAESFERIHRSNLVGMGVLPLEFKPGENVETLGLTGFETFDILGLDNTLSPRQEVTLRVTDGGGKSRTFQAICRIDTPVEIKYYRNGGILHAVLRDILRKEGR